MIDIALSIAGLALILLGLAILALSQNSHWRAASSAVTPLSPGQKRALRSTGSIIIVAALPTLMFGNGKGFGTLAWVMLQPVAAVVVAFTLTWHSQILRPLTKLVLLNPPEVRIRRQQAFSSHK